MSQAGQTCAATLAPVLYRLQTKLFQYHEKCDSSLGAAGKMEDSAGVLHHLFRLGIYLSRDPGWRPPDAALRDGRHSVHRCWAGALVMDACPGNSVADLARMARGHLAGLAHVPSRLRMSVLGGTARAVGYCRRHHCNHSGLYHAAGDHFSEDPAPHSKARTRFGSWCYWGRGTGESMVLFWRGAAGSWGRRRLACGFNRVVNRHSSKPPACDARI